MIDKSAFNWRKLVNKTQMPSGAHHLAIYLSCFMNDDQDVAWPSQARIVYETGLSKSTVNKYLNWLEENHWIVRERGGPSCNTRYFTNIPDDTILKITKGSPPRGQGSPSDALGSPSGGQR